MLRDCCRGWLEIGKAHARVFVVVECMKCPHSDELEHLQRTDANDHPASERVCTDRIMGKSQPSGPTQIDRGGPTDPFLAQMWERDGSARTCKRSAHASVCAFSCLANPAWQPDCVEPSSPPLVLASLHRRFGLV
jgi:hypothetical protein